MVGPTLIDIRKHIEGLATDDGRYYVACGRTGDRPVPAAGNRFPDRATARAAARATEQYRSALRRYDPQVPYYDLIVCQDMSQTSTATGRSDVPTDDPAQAGDDAELDEVISERRTLVEFCHRVAGAVFETLSEHGHDATESVIMDTYFELAETVSDPDELCLCLLESMASELDDRLKPADQAEVLASAATRLGLADDTTSPLDAALSVLETRGLIERYRRSPWSVDLDDGTRSVVVSIDGYALSPCDGRLPVLPLTIELFRNRTRRLPRSVETSTSDDGWQLTFHLEETTDRDGLISAPIDGRT
jgi:hypothetical protein